MEDVVWYVYIINLICFYFSSPNLVFFQWHVVHIRCLFDSQIHHVMQVLLQRMDPYEILIRNQNLGEIHPSKRRFLVGLAIQTVIAKVGADIFFHFGKSSLILACFGQLRTKGLDCNVGSNST